MTGVPAGDIPPQLGRLSVRDLQQDPYPTLAGLRTTASAVAVENNGYRMWLITRYDDVRRVLKDKSVVRDLVEHRRTVNSRCMVRPEQRARLPHGSRRSFFDRDGKVHRNLRSMVAQTFTPPRVEAMRPKVERVVAELLDTLPVGVPVDLTARFAKPLALRIIGDITGIPPDKRAPLPALETTLLTSPVISEIEDSAKRLFGFALEMVELKRAHPADDLFTALLHAHDRGDGMTDDELTSTYFLMVIAGMEPAAAIGNGVQTLLSHPTELRRVVAAPEQWPDCVEEILRFESPFRFLPPRFSTAPLELDDVTIPAGELLLIAPSAANRDPSRFEDPDTFDASRCPRGHLAFGHGPHHCLGNRLGRLETTTALRRLFERYPDTTVVNQEAPPDWRPGKFMRRLGSLPVILK